MGHPALFAGAEDLDECCSSPMSRSLSGRLLATPGSPLRPPQPPGPPSDDGMSLMSEAARVQRRLFAAAAAAAAAAATAAGSSEAMHCCNTQATAGHAPAPPRLRLRLPHEAAAGHVGAMESDACAPSPCDTPAAGSAAGSCGSPGSSNVSTWLAAMEGHLGSRSATKQHLALALELPDDADSPALLAMAAHRGEAAGGPTTRPGQLPPPAFVLLGVLN